MFPSAFSAMQATPGDHRFSSLPNVRRGMVAYWDDPNDSNPFGHITAVAGRAKDGELLHWTNDAVALGRVSLVRHSFFKQFWGDSFVFASDWLNGQELDLPDLKRKPAHMGIGGAPLIQEAVERLEKAAAYHRKKHHPRLVKALERDIAHLKRVLTRFGGIE